MLAVGGGGGGGEVAGSGGLCVTEVNTLECQSDGDFSGKVKCAFRTCKRAGVCVGEGRGGGGGVCS